MDYVRFAAALVSPPAAWVWIRRLMGWWVDELICLLVDEFICDRRIFKLDIVFSFWPFRAISLESLESLVLFVSAFVSAFAFAFAFAFVGNSPPSPLNALTCNSPPPPLSCYRIFCWLQFCLERGEVCFNCREWRIYFKSKYNDHKLLAPCSLPLAF